MAVIHILDSETIDKIAAGEVVERPASVVKELVENAIDAGATSITVEAREGGIEFIRVTDNGCGMEREQLRRAFLRHATSKIEGAEDLTRISSLGFRGEALSSIAAVSKVEVVTRTSDSITGSRILLEGARETGFDEVGAPEGTTFLMRSLFYNTPARRKFLRQPPTEGGYIADLMEHLALSRPDVSFKLVLNGQTKFHTSGSGDLREVIYRIYGRDVAGALVPIQAGEGSVRLEGYLGKPVLVRSNRNMEIYFINGRFIRSSMVAKALETGYKEYLMQHKFPFCVLHIVMDAAQVDVNVHPTKMDVRFSRAMEFCSYLAETVQQTLRQQEMIPEASLSTEKELRQQRQQEKALQESARPPEPFEQRRRDAYRLMEEAKYAAEVPKKQDFAHTPVWNRVKTVSSEAAASPEAMVCSEAAASSAPAVSGETVSSPEESAFDDAFFTETDETERENAAEIMRGGRDCPGESGGEDKAPGAEAFQDKTSPQEHWGEEGLSAGEISPDISQGDPVSAVQLDLFEEKILTAQSRSRFRLIGQVFETYWLIEFEDRMLMVDQHAAHEKVNYERLMRQYRSKSVLSQGLLPPVIVTLNGREESTLKENLETFTALGFEIESFGGSEYALRSVPVDLYGCGEQEMFLEVLDSLAEGTGFGGLRVIEEKIASMSCKAAVKGNNRLSPKEAERLIDELLTLDNPYNCPHGRPTIVAMTRAEMDRKFKRIVT